MIKEMTGLFKQMCMPMEVSAQGEKRNSISGSTQHSSIISTASCGTVITQCMLDKSCFSLEIEGISQWKNYT